MTREHRRPSPVELEAARGRTVADLVAPGVTLLLCGINPSLWSACVGLHFARPGNRLWGTLAAAGLTPRRLLPTETGALLASGIGVTNLVARATARAEELSPGELAGGLPRLTALAEGVRPRVVAFLGISAYRVATRQRTARVGPRPERVGPARAWLLPNPSGLNASYQQPALTRAYADLAAALRGDTDPWSELDA